MHELLLAIQLTSQVVPNIQYMYSCILGHRYFSPTSAKPSGALLHVTTETTGETIPYGIYDAECQANFSLDKNSLFNGTFWSCDRRPIDDLVQRIFEKS